MDKKIFPDEPEIPILPNLFTAGNLVCGFFAILTIFEGINQADSDAVAAFSYYQNATFLIFAACLFDLFDGRIARMRGQDGPFGREFDSLADIVSFGIAPALLVAKAVLFQLSPPEVGWGWTGFPWNSAVEPIFPIRKISACSRLRARGPSLPACAALRR